MFGQRKGKTSKESFEGFRLKKTYIYRKMVNVASHIPFNLHNAVLPPARSYGSVSRSTSGSLEQHPRDHNHQTDYSKYGIGHQPTFYVSSFNDRSRSASPSSGPSHTKCLSRTSAPILNVRLVGGYTDSMTKSRGRTLSRSTDMHNLTHGTTRIEGEGVTTTAANAETSCEGLVGLFCAVKLFIGLTFVDPYSKTAASAFKLRDVGSITVNWND